MDFLTCGSEDLFTKEYKQKSFFDRGIFPEPPKERFANLSDNSVCSREIIKMFENEAPPSWRSDFSIWRPMKRKNMRLRTKRLQIPSLYCPLMRIHWKAVLRRGI